MGRPSKAKPIQGGDLYPAVVDMFLGRADDSTLVRNVSREEILEAVKTVGGIAKLARVDRKTVYRLKIPVNSIHAIEFVRNRRRDIGAPLVVERVPNPLSGRASSDYFLTVVTLIRSIRRSRSDPPRMALRDPTLKKSSRRRSQNVHAYEIYRDMTPEERKLFRRAYYYKPRDRVTVQELLSALRISRVAFWKWRKSLQLAQRKQLEIELKWKPSVNASPVPGEIHPVTKEAFNEFDYDAVDERLPNG